MHQQRTRVWIDRFQTVLSLRIAFYFLFYQAAVWCAVIIDWNLSRGVANLISPEFASKLMLVLFGGVIFVGFLFIYDAVAFAHRIVGPLVRFRNICQAIREGEPVGLVRLREGDFLQEFKDEFNDMLRVLEQRGALTLQSGNDKASEPKSAEAVAR